MKHPAVQVFFGDFATVMSKKTLEQPDVS